MQRYANKGRDSGVTYFEITADSITVQFKGGMNYVYDSYRPGSGTVAHLKALALSGHGLNSYISSVVKSNYSRKYR